MTPTFLAWVMLVLVTDWVEMKSSWFSLLSLSRKGRSRRGEIRTQKKKKKIERLLFGLFSFHIRSFIFPCELRMYIFCHFLC